MYLYANDSFQLYDGKRVSTMYQYGLIPVGPRNRNMSNRMQLLGESLDALPVNVSVLDPEGMILQTNQSWQEFGEQNGIRMRPDTAGVNYLNVCDRSKTETATAARRGLTELLAGERQQFQLEYPCHSPVEQRWFLLVAVPVILDQKRHAVVAHINITDQKRRERQLEAEVARLEALTDLTAAVREITQTVISQSTRSEIEQAVCDQLAGANGYDCARIGEVDGRTGRFTVRASAGRFGSIQECTESDELFGATVIREAVWTGQLQTTTHRRENTAFDWRQDAPPVATKRAVAAVPIRHAETLYSVLTIYTERPDAFSTEERTTLSELGEVVGHAIAASERTQALMSDELIEVELRIRDLFPHESPSTDWTVEITQTVAGPDDDYTMYGTTTEAEIEAVAAVIDPLDVAAVTVIGGSGESVRIALRLSQQCVIPLLASHGWSTETAVLSNGDCYLTVHLPSGDNVREMVETVCEVFPNTELLARRQIHVDSQVDMEIQESAVAELTNRQRTVLQTAYAAGYFQWPRDATGAEIAESLGIAPPTFHQHLRVGQQKLMDTIFGELPVAV